MPLKSWYLVAIKCIATLPDLSEWAIPVACLRRTRAGSARLLSVRWGDGRAVEGARLLSVYRSNAPIEGSNPSLSASANDSDRAQFIGCWDTVHATILTPVASACSSGDRALGCGPKGRRFESCQAYHSRPSSGGFFVNLYLFAPILPIPLTRTLRLWYNPARRGVRAV